MILEASDFPCHRFSLIKKHRLISNKEHSLLRIIRLYYQQNRSSFHDAATDHKADQISNHQCQNLLHSKPPKTRPRTPQAGSEFWSLATTPPNQPSQTATPHPKKMNSPVSILMRSSPNPQPYSANYLNSSKMSKNTIARRTTTPWTRWIIGITRW